MSEPNQQAGKLPALAGHAIQVFLQADPPANDWSHQTTTMGDLPPKAANPSSSGVWLPDAIRPALAGRYVQSPVWEKATIDAGSDFHKHLRNLVCGKREDSELAILASATPLTLRLLQKADFYAADTPPKDRATHRLLWRPRENALRRLAENNFVPASAYGVVVSSLLYYAFRTGIGFTVAAVEIVPLDELVLRPLDRPLYPVELQEAVVAISRAGLLTWQVPGHPPTQKPGFSFASILHNLTGGGATPRRSVERIFTYAYVKFAAAVPVWQADRFGLFLARHYTSDYALTNETAGIVRVRDFETVGHVMALEGAATIVAPSAATGTLPDFLDNFETGTWRQHYVPIALLAQHEHAFLVDKTTESNFWLSLENSIAEPSLENGMPPWYAYPPYRRPAALSPHPRPSAAATRQDIEKLEKLRLQSLKFRLAFRFSQVSLIAMHNAVNRGFREALGLDRMLGELSMDVAEANVFLAQISEDRKKTVQEKLEGRLFHAERIFGAILIGIGVYQVADLWYQDTGLTGKQIALHAAAWTAASALLAFLYQTLNEKLRQAKIERGDT